MKLRIRGNSIRLRLTRSEVEQIGRGEAVTETTRLGAGVDFSYSLRASEASALEVSLSGTALVISAPSASLADWASSEAVALDCVSGGETATIMVEKDFACLTPRDEDDDTYPHPDEGTRRC